MKILGSHWYNPGATVDCIGVVKVENGIGEIKYYIGIGKGVDLKADEVRITDFGAKFPKEMGDLLNIS